MDVNVYKIDYKDVTPRSGELSFSEKVISKGKRLRLVPERMPLQEALRKKLSFSTNFMHNPVKFSETIHTNALWRRSSVPQYDFIYSGNNGCRESFQIPNFLGLELDHKDSKEIEMPALRVLDSSQLMTDQNGKAAGCKDQVNQMLPFTMPVLSHRRMNFKINIDRQGVNNTGRRFYIDALSKRGLVGMNVSYGSIDVSRTSEDFWKYHTRNGLTAYRHQVVKWDETNGVEAMPLSALTGLIKCETKLTSDSVRARSTRLFDSFVGDSFPTHEAAVVPEINEDFIMECIVEYCEWARNSDPSLWSTIVNSLTCCLGRQEKDGQSSHYQVGKAGVYLIKPELKGTIKKRDDLYNLILADNGINAHVFTVEEMTQDCLMPFWMSILFNTNRMDHTTQNNGIMPSDLKTIADNFHEHWNFVPESLVDHYVTEVDGKKYVGYGNAYKTFREGGIRYGAAEQKFAEPTSYPVVLHCRPLMHENWDDKVFGDLAAIYNSEFVPSEDAIDRVKRQATLTFNGSYNPDTNKFSISPNMCHVCPDPKRYDAESMGVLRSTIKHIWPEAKFVGRSLTFIISADSCNGPAFRLNIANTTQCGRVEIDQNLSKDQKSSIYSKNAFEDLVHKVFKLCYENSVTIDLPCNHSPLGGISDMYVQAATGEDLRDLLRLHGLKISGTKDEQCRRLAEKFAEIYENMEFDSAIAEVIPFDNLVFFKDGPPSNDYYGSRASTSSVNAAAMTHLQNLMPVYSVDTPTIESGNLNLGEGCAASNKLMKLVLKACREFKVSYRDFMNIVQVYIIEHTASGSIFRKSHKDSLRTPENLFYEMLSKGECMTENKWKGIQL